FITDPRSQKMYGVPSEITTYGLLYSGKLFDKFGLKAPKTWQDFLDAGETLKKNNVAPVALAGTIGFYNRLWWENLLLRLCPSISTAYDVIRLGKGSVKDDPCYLQAAQMVDNIRQKGFFQPGYEGRDHTASQTEWIQGKAGMLLLNSNVYAEMAPVPADF